MDALLGRWATAANAAEPSASESDMTRKPDHGPVRAALEVTIKSDARLASDRNAALVALARVTADQVDQAGAEVSSRLIASYLSALKDIDRALADRSPAGAPAGKGAGAGGALGKLQGIAGGKVS